jgi:hypothetical protein
VKATRYAYVALLKKFGGIPPMQRSSTHEGHFKTALELLEEGPQADSHPEQHCPSYEKKELGRCANRCWRYSFGF